MGKVILCTGQTAEHPYFFKDVNRNIFTIEELCYLILQNGFLYEEELLSKKLIDWIGEECKLPELSKQLFYSLKEEKNLKNFVMTIFHFVKLYDDETLSELENVLEIGEDLSFYEKKKKKIDLLVKNGKYEMALNEYEKMLTDLPQLETSLSAKIWHNKGVIYANMFTFNEAAKCFKKSYDLVPDENSIMQFLASKRMELSDVDYISFIAEHDEYYEVSLKFEKRIEEAVEYYNEGSQKKFLDEMKLWYKGEERKRYYDECQKTITKLKDNYRFHVLK